MAADTRSRSLTQVELLFVPEVPLEERQKSLFELDRRNRPDQDTIAAIITLLNDPDDSLRLMAESVLCRWGQQSITMLLQALRSTQPTDVPYRLAIIGQLGRMGPTAARAETLLRSMMQDKDVGEAANKALRAIRLDGDDLIWRLFFRGGELFLLTVVVAVPMVAIRLAAPNQPMPPLGLSIGMASLCIVGLMLAKTVYAADLLPGGEDEIAPKPGQWNIYAIIAVGGAVVGAALGG